MTHPPQSDVYPEIARDDVRPFIPRSARSALDVGCGPGGFGPTLRAALGDEARLVGVEAGAAQAAKAREGHGFDEVVDGYFPDALGGRDERFDLISFNDVLEHIVDPWTLLRETREWLTPTGRVLAAIPSIQYAPVVWRLIRGRWDYQDWGTLDRTHVRFFTRQTTVEMFEQNGYRVISCQGANGIEQAWSHDHNRLRRWVKLALIPLLGDAKFLHFVILAEPVEVSG